MTAVALRRLETDHGWYRALGAEDRSWLTLVVQAAVSSFLTWLQDDAVGDASPRDPVMREVFAEAPRELTRAISLAHTLELVRTVVDVVEHEVASYAGRTDERPCARPSCATRARSPSAPPRCTPRRRSRAAPGTPASRRSSSTPSSAGRPTTRCRAGPTALGWGSVQGVASSPAPARDVGAAAAVDAVRRAAARAGVEALAALQRRRLVVILGGLRPPTGASRDGAAEQPARVVASLAEHFGDGPVVIGPTVPHLFAAGRSARAALSGLAAVPAWPAAPRPVLADDLLPERVLQGDGPARRTLVDRVHHPLVQHPALLATATEFLEQGRSLEATARALYVHPNTVRYRLGRIATLVGYDLTVPREALAVQVALAVGRLAEPEPRPWRSGVAPRRSGLDARRDVDRTDLDLEETSNDHAEDSWASVPPDGVATGEA